MAAITIEPLANAAQLSTHVFQELSLTQRTLETMHTGIVSGQTVPLLVSLPALITTEIVVQDNTFPTVPAILVGLYHQMDTTQRQDRVL